MERLDLVSIGEMLIDFTSDAGASQGGSLRFTGNAGGAPANVAVGARRLGLRSAFIGKAGKDTFGSHLERVLLEEGVDASGLILDVSTRTTLAFVSLDESGDRSFTFYRNPGADSMLREDELDHLLISSCRALVHGSISLIDEPSRSATLSAIKAAKEAGAAICFDPNLRKALWPSIDCAKQVIFSALATSDLVKVSDEELLELTGASSIEDGLAKLRKASGADPVMAVSMGPHGSMISSKELSILSEGFRVDTVDTTGAGDAFLAALLLGVMRMARGVPIAVAMSGFDASDWSFILGLANAAGAVCATRKGAIPALPSLGELKSFLKGRGLDASWLD